MKTEIVIAYCSFCKVSFQTVKGFWVKCPVCCFGMWVKIDGEFQKARGVMS